MKLKYLICIVFTTISLYKCGAKENNDITLEGKWQVIDWTYYSYTGRGLDEKEIEKMDDTFIDLIFEFTTESYIKTNKANLFPFLDNKRFYVINPSLNFEVSNRRYFIRNRDNEKFFFIIDNIILQIKKIENHLNSKILIEKLENFKTEKQTPKEFTNFYSIDEIDTAPQIIGYQPKGDDKEFIIASFKNSIIDFIDYSLIEDDITLDISFIIDKQGNIQNTKISPMNEINDDITKTIISFPKFVSGIKDDNKVNTQFSFKLRLISK
ncbi:hypothetical protein [Zhouia amylolytica]|uniref:Uncharacterized protein n=1 Tax=Zhouia amylolytica AD3 TaxID=1286632 RepID=W2URK5_9FLAO|nr:hypothetical protein [Zhouia amylolytica]ETN96584.1 hypothetical protein P278_00100 [Zhouia amylolytica AD3]